MNARFAAPIDEALIGELAGSHRLIVTLEENVKSGGFGEHVEAFISEHYPGTHVLCKAVPDRFLPHGKPDELRREIGLDAESITGSIIKALS